MGADLACQYCKPTRRTRSPAGCETAAHSRSDRPICHGAAAPQPTPTKPPRAPHHHHHRRRLNYPPSLPLPSAEPPRKHRSPVRISKATSWKSHDHRLFRARAPFLLPSLFPHTSPPPPRFVSLPRGALWELQSPGILKAPSELALPRSPKEEALKKNRLLVAFGGATGWLRGAHTTQALRAYSRGALPSDRFLASERT